MQLPDDILVIIKEYSKSITRPDWRQGSYYKQNYSLFNYLIQQIAREYKIRRLVRNFGLMYHAFFVSEED